MNYNWHILDHVSAYLELAELIEVKKTPNDFNSLGNLKIPHIEKNRY